MFDIPYIHVYTAVFIIYLLFTIINTQAIFWFKKPMDLGAQKEHYNWFINDFKKFLIVNAIILGIVTVLILVIAVLQPWGILNVIVFLIALALSFAFFYLGAKYLKNLLNRHFKTDGDESLVRQYYNHRYPIYLAVLLSLIFSLVVFAVSVLSLQLGLISTLVI